MTDQTIPNQKNWREIIARYQEPDKWRSIWQVVNSLVPYLVFLVLMYFSLSVSYWLTLLLAIPASGFMVRLFIIFHDCGHGSFFKSQRASTFVGYLTGILTFTPYHQWRHDHAIHHATAGDLDRRGVGDVPTMTVNEYLTAPRLKRWGYFLLRNPLVLFGVGQFFVFLLSHRFWGPTSGKREKLSVVYTNLALLGIVVLASLTIGWKAYVLIQLPIAWLGGALGEWLFYVQHQFPGVHWSRHKDWDYYRSAIEGASFYNLPKIFQWFTGNIGFHHVHHLGPRIPNYLLEKCHRENSIFSDVKPVTLLSSLKCLALNLWDEERRQLVSFWALRQLAPQKVATNKNSG